MWPIIINNKNDRFMRKECYSNHNLIDCKNIYIYYITHLGMFHNQS